MLVDLSQEEQALIENYRKAGEQDREAIRWAAEVAARATRLRPGGNG